MPQDPDFSREAARVLGGPYFMLPPPDLTGAALVKWWDDRTAEKNALTDACERADDYAALPDDARAIYDRAREALHQHLDHLDYLDRFHT